jgi:hypothetical protein
MVVFFLPRLKRGKTRNYCKLSIFWRNISFIIFTDVHQCFWLLHNKSYYFNNNSVVVIVW